MYKLLKYIHQLFTLLLIPKLFLFFDNILFCEELDRFTFSITKSIVDSIDILFLNI